MRLVQRSVENASTAEDVTQSMWLRIQRIDDYPPIVNWLITVGMHRSLRRGRALDTWQETAHARSISYASGQVPASLVVLGSECGSANFRDNVQVADPSTRAFRRLHGCLQLR
ncbi:hypothetical protein TQ38_021070 [Novosphingobium sp. P6W]|nr:hypothetical protein TQ38_021070 [Novosphingobium sp. P6W]